MLSRISTKTKVKKGMDPAKKKILFVLAVIFSCIVLFGLYNLKQIAPDNKEKIPVKVESGDQPVKKEVSVVINTGGAPLNMRDGHDANAEIIGQIPDGTKLKALEEIDGWYKVPYDGREGWISKEYTKLVEDETESQESFDGKSFKGSGYTFEYPSGWNARDYSGNNQIAWIAISKDQLPAKAPIGGYFVPIELKVYPLSAKPTGDFREEKDTKKENMKVAGVKAVKYTFVNEDTSTETIVVSFEHSGKLYDFYDNGGYFEDLENILDTFLFL